jgi:hypothetical protein
VARKRHYRRRIRRIIHRRRRLSRRRGSTSLLAPRSKGLWGLIGTVAAPVAFLDQLTSKDRGAYSGDMFHKAKTLVNNITGNIFNFNLFSDVTKFQQNINPAGIANKYTGIGVASIIASMILPRLGLRIPMMSRAFSIGKKLLPAGILGGFFDAPGGSNYSNYATQTHYSYNNGQTLTSTVGN